MLCVIRRSDGGDGEGMDGTGREGIDGRSARLASRHALFLAAVGRYLCVGPPALFFLHSLGYKQAGLYLGFFFFGFGMACVYKTATTKFWT